MLLLRLALQHNATVTQQVDKTRKARDDVIFKR